MLNSQQNDQIRSPNQLFSKAFLKFREKSASKFTSPTILIFIQVGLTFLIMSICLTCLQLSYLCLRRARSFCKIGLDHLFQCRILWPWCAWCSSTFLSHSSNARTTGTPKLHLDLRFNVMVAFLKSISKRSHLIRVVVLVYLLCCTRVEEKFEKYFGYLARCKENICI